jgi:two-component system, NtrC family, nitrogen regulation response regulator GlnG
VVEPKDLPPELLGNVPVAPVLPPAAIAEVPAAAMPVPLAAPDPLLVAALPQALSTAPHWLADLEREARHLLESGTPEVWEMLTRQFEGQLIHTALEVTRGRRIEAAQKLGIGRNTITRKIQELGLDE